MGGRRRCRWLDDRGPGGALFEAGAACPPGGRIVEIGSFQGRSTIVLALAAPADVEIIAIDPHAGNDRGPQEIDGYQDAASDDLVTFEANLAAAGVRDRVTHVRQFSDRAHGLVDGEIDVLYVDGAHRYGPARADISRLGCQGETRRQVADPRLVLVDRGHRLRYCESCC